MTDPTTAPEWVVSANKQIHEQIHGHAPNPSELPNSSPPEWAVKECKDILAAEIKSPILVREYGGTVGSFARALESAEAKGYRRGVEESIQRLGGRYGAAATKDLRSLIERGPGEKKP